MVESEQVQNRSLEIMNVDLVFGYGKTQFVRFAVADASSNATAGEKN